MEENRGKRIAWLDIAKGIAIVCTVVGHTVPAGGKLCNLIYSFHMPLFFVLAGYTMRPLPAGGLCRATAKDFRRLVIPVLAVRLLNFVCDVLFRGASAMPCLAPPCPPF